MKIYFAADHAGFEMKNKLIEFVKNMGYETEDCGAYELNPEDDYPEFINKAAKSVAENPDSLGIIMGGSGQGEAMAANRIPGVRAAVYYTVNTGILKLSKQHNNANVLSLASRFLSQEDAEEAVRLWLKTPFSEEERHVRRIAQF